MKLTTIWIMVCTIIISVGPALGSPDDFRKRVSQKTVTYTEVDDVRAELIFGRGVGARILGKYGIYKDDALTRYINLVGKGVSLHAGRPEIELRFAVIDTDTVNAFAAPGGYVFVTKGALKIMEDEAELAAVLAHETAHVVERHIVKELNIKATDESPAAGLAALIGGTTGTMRVTLQQMVDKAAEILFEKGYKRQDEMDADRIATSLITTAGYDPTALSRYLKRISTAEGDKTKMLKGTHPPFVDRIENLERFMADNALMDKKQPVVKGRFHENVNLR